MGMFFHQQYPSGSTTGMRVGQHSFGAHSFHKPGLPSHSFTHIGPNASHTFAMPKHAGKLAAGATLAGAAGYGAFKFHQHHEQAFQNSISSHIA